MVLESEMRWNESFKVLRITQCQAVVFLADWKPWRLMSERIANVTFFMKFQLARSYAHKCVTCLRPWKYQALPSATVWQPQVRKTTPTIVSASSSSVGVCWTAILTARPVKAISKQADKPSAKWSLSFRSSLQGCSGDFSLKPSSCSGMVYQNSS